MRVEFIQCDTCAKKHDAQYTLPTDWIRTIQRTHYGLEDEHHFCSKKCLVKWAGVFEISPLTGEVIVSVEEREEEEA